MNLLMQAPLLDSRGNLRYFIGAQIDVSGLVKEATDLDAFQQLLDEEEGVTPQLEAKDEFQELCEMFNHSELDAVRKFGGNMHRDHLEDQDGKSIGVQRPRLLIQDQSTFDLETAEKPPPKPEGRLAGPYKHVILTSTQSEREADNITVPPRPPSPLSTHSLYISLASRARYSSVTFPRPYRRLSSRTRIREGRPCRRLARCDSQNSLAPTRRPEPRDIVRRRSAALDTLHSAPRRQWKRGDLDDCHC